MARLLEKEFGRQEQEIQDIKRNKTGFELKEENKANSMDNYEEEVSERFKPSEGQLQSHTSDL